MTRIKGALFDKDGTLIDFTAAWRGLIRSMITDYTGEDRALARQIGKAIGFDIDNGLFLAGSPVVAGSTGEVAALIAAVLPGVSAADIEHDANARAAAVNSGSGLAPTPGLVPAFRRLKEMGLVLGVATHNSERAARAHARALGLADMLSFYAGYDSGHGHKPGPGMVLAFCEANGLEPSEVVMIGDSLHDLGAGRSARAAASIGVLTGPATEEELAPHADAVIAGVSELPEFLLREFPAA